MTCGKLSMGILGADCQNPMVPGVKPKAIIINNDDIDIDQTIITDGIISELVLKSGAVAYKAETLNNGIDVNVAFAKGTYLNGWDHNFVLRLFDNTPEVKKFVDQLSKSRITVIIENNYVKYNDVNKGNTVYEVYGFYVGLELNEAVRDAKDADTKGGYVLTCGCNESMKEPVLPITLFNGTLEATRKMVEELTVADAGI